MGKNELFFNVGLLLYHKQNQLITHASADCTGKADQKIPRKR